MNNHESLELKYEDIFKTEDVEINHKLKIYSKFLLKQFAKDPSITIKNDNIHIDEIQLKCIIKSRIYSNGLQILTLPYLWSSCNIRIVNNTIKNIEVDAIVELQEIFIVYYTNTQHKIFELQKKVFTDMLINDIFDLNMYRSDIECILERNKIINIKFNELTENIAKLDRNDEHYKVVDFKFEDNLDLSTTLYSNFNPTFFYIKINTIFKINDYEDDEYADEVDDENYDEENNSKLQLATGFFENILQVAETLYYVKNNYKFFDNFLVNPEQYLELTTINQLFPLSDRYKCCVCYNKTFNVTSCNHHICFKCRYECVCRGNCACPLCNNENLNIFYHN